MLGRWKMLWSRILLCCCIIMNNIDTVIITANSKLPSLFAAIIPVQHDCFPTAFLPTKEDQTIFSHYFHSHNPLEPRLADVSQMWLIFSVKTLLSQEGTTESPPEILHLDPSLPTTFHSGLSRDSS